MKRFIIAIGCLLCATAGAQKAKKTSHTVSGSGVTITDLGLLPGGSISRGLAINNQPLIIGLATDSSFALQRPFWNAQTGEIIGFADNLDPASTAIPEHLNNNKEMAGTEAIGSRVFRAVYWNPAGRAFSLPPLDGFGGLPVYAHGINDLSQIVGANEDSNFVPHAVLWQNKDTTPQDLGVLGHAYGINDLSHIAGFTSGLGTTMHGFLWRNGNAIQLNDLAGQNISEAFAINNTGRIAGDSGNFPVTWNYDVTNNGSVPVIEQLPIPSGFSTATGRAVNDAGDVAGWAGAATINSHAILWRDGVAIDLGLWPGGTYSVANGINDRGQIVGTGTVAPDFLDHALMWTVDGGGGIPCADLISFQVRCKPFGGGNHKLQARLTLTDTSHSGEQVTMTVDGRPTPVTINGNQGQLSINNPPLGEHTIALTDPAGCFPPAMPSCE